VSRRLSSKIDSNGRLTVPVEVRRRLGLKTGDLVVFAVNDGHTVLRPARPATNPFEKFVSTLPVFKSRAEINRWVRGLRDVQEGELRGT
jgi:antitoxin PrlF